MKILFFGTPRFAELVLQKLLSSSHQVVGVVCQNSKRAGRGKKIRNAQIVEMAREANIPVFQFEKLSQHVEDFKNIGAEVGVSASYGKFIPSSVLEILPTVNVHPSLLPKFRGPTPIQSALLCGEQKTGVTIMKTDAGMDSGAIYQQEEVKILPEDDYFSLHDRLAEVGARLLLETLEKIENGTAKLTPQKNEDATFCKLIEKEDAHLDFSLSAQSLVQKVKAFAASPVAFFELDGKRIKVHKAKVADDEFAKSCSAGKGAGQIVCTKKRFLIATSCGVFEGLTLQAEGAKPMDAASFLNGFRFGSLQIEKSEKVG